MNFQILISTVDDAFLNRSFLLNCPHIVINQLINKKKSDYEEGNIYSYRESGLSKSRNKAIKEATADICLISDDDLSYKKDIEEIILLAFSKNPNADIITFQVETPDGEKYKNYYNYPYQHNFKTIMKVSSVEVAFKRQSIINNDIFFDELFGLGSAFPTSEEAIFLSDALKKGLTILSLPEVIVTHPKESSGGDYKNLKLAQAKGAMLYRIFGWKAYVVIFLFAIKHFRKTPYSISEFLSEMFAGFKYYKKREKDGER